MLQLVPIEIVDFVDDVAAKNGLSLLYYESEDPTTLMLVQPMDEVVKEGPNGKLTSSFVAALQEGQKSIHLPLPIHIEAYAKRSPLPFGITENLPDLVHMVRISTLE